MTSYVLDTHIWAWAIKLDKQLTSRIAEVLLAAETVHLSAISFYEIAQKVRIGKWPEMQQFVDEMPSVLSDQGGQLVDVSGQISQLAGLLDWNHRDPFDRMIAATSITLKLPLISADTAFDELSGRKDWPGRVW